MKGGTMLSPDPPALSPLEPGTNSGSNVGNCWKEAKHTIGFDISICECQLSSSIEASTVPMAHR